ncbi:MAG: D-tyrosyl-tRNA(Tyr) deacylase [Proteobacteria bacterium]|jgi:D-tyrosyl-tRNA(Tyr) deacylase|nr:D-tyrosyl-tRNA(Tyr) deacylase [Pseudomonadota bacterium]
MIALLQRVTTARVVIKGNTVAHIGPGLLTLIGVEKNDAEAEADRLLQRLLDYRVFADAEDKMNLSLRDINGDLLLVPQFTLAADTGKGLRPGFSRAASPQEGRRLFDYLCSRAQALYPRIATGRFGADMQITLTNDGPVTFWLETGRGE